MTETSSKYKDSNNEWIGKIPIEWNMATVRNGYEITLGKMVQPEPKSFTDVLVPYLKAMNVQDGYIKSEKIEEMYANRNELEVYKISKGDLLVCEGGEVARSAIVEGEYEGYVFQNSIHRVKAKKDNSIEYLHYLLVALRNSGFINILVNKATIAHFTKDKFNSLKIPLPTAEEQKEIVLYIEGKEKEISRLINKKLQLITLLEEKCQSIITEAITKGINSNVKMKDSGIEWIGDVPEHWKIGKLKSLFILQRGHDLTHTEFIEGEIPVYGSNGVMGYHNKITTKGPNITIGRSGSVGKINYVKEDFWAHNTSIYIKEVKKNNLRYLYYILKSLDIESLSTQTAVPTLDRKQVQNVVYPYTTNLNEQKEIATYLDKKIKNINKSTENINNQIQKLIEYRQSLIYEAVTGKINVRELIAEK